MYILQNFQMDSVNRLIKLLESQTKEEANNNIKSVGLYDEFTSINLVITI